MASIYCSLALQTRWVNLCDPSGLHGPWVTCKTCFRLDRPTCRLRVWYFFYGTFFIRLVNPTAKEDTLTLTHLLTIFSCSEPFDIIVFSFWSHQLGKQNSIFLNSSGFLQIPSSLFVLMSQIMWFYGTFLSIYNWILVPLLHVNNTHFIFVKKLLIVFQNTSTFCCSVCYKGGVWTNKYGPGQANLFALIWL